MAEKLKYVISILKDGVVEESYANHSPTKMVRVDDAAKYEYKIELTDPENKGSFEVKEVKQEEETDPTTRTQDQDQTEPKEGFKIEAGEVANTWKLTSGEMGNHEVRIEDKNGVYEHIDLYFAFKIIDPDSGEDVTPMILKSKAMSEMSRITSNLSTPSGFIKVVDKQDKIKAILNPDQFRDIPLVQIPKAYIDEYKNADLTIDKDLFKDYKFDYGYLGNLNHPIYPEYGKEIDRLIQEDKKARGTTRLKYCFSVKTKIGSGSFSFFYDDVNRELVCIQSLETWLNDNMKIKTISGSEINYVLVAMYRIGRPHPHDGKEKDYSPAEIISRAGEDKAAVIQANQATPVSELYDLLVTNNNDLSAHLITIPNAAMYEGRNASYPQAIVEEAGVNVLKSNTPVILCINLGKTAALTKSQLEDQIPNYILTQYNGFNNYYIHSNGNACDANSNFCIFLPLY